MSECRKRYEAFFFIQVKPFKPSYLFWDIMQIFVRWANLSLGSLIQYLSMLYIRIYECAKSLFDRIGPTLDCVDTRLNCFPVLS